MLCSLFSTVYLMKVFFEATTQLIIWVLQTASAEYGLPRDEESSAIHDKAWTNC
jgi:hypothetical protein